MCRRLQAWTRLLASLSLCPLLLAITGLFLDSTPPGGSTPRVTVLFCPKCLQHVSHFDFIRCHWAAYPAANVIDTSMSMIMIHKMSLIIDHKMSLTSLWSIPDIFSPSITENTLQLASLSTSEQTVQGSLVTSQSAGNSNKQRYN